jgi:23S rRNA (guanosine2251-2'-O)-methyltransferase
MKPPSSSFRPPGGKPPRGPARGGSADTPPRRNTGAATWSGGARNGPGPAAKTGPAHGEAPARGGQPGPAPRQPRLSAPGAGQASAPAAHTPRPAPRTAPHPGQGGARPQAPAGTIWLYGLHPVAAALANPARRLRRLLVTEEAEATLAGMLSAAFSVPPERTERSRLDHLLGHDAAHQGVALLADPLSPPALATVLERAGPLLVLDQVTDPRNVGAILRSAAAFGVAGVIAQDRNAPEETGALAKAASGALEIVPLIRAVNLARTLVALKAAGLWTVGLAADGAPLRGDSLRQRRVALVLGAEGAGMRRLTRETCDELAGLKMPGNMESLNVSNAAAVALYELTRA